MVLPQAIRRVFPPLLNDFIALQKETSPVGVIGPIEAARQAQIYASRTFNFTSYLAAALLFGFPLRSTVVLLGIAVVPILVFPIAWALTFDSAMLS